MCINITGEPDRCGHPSATSRAQCIQKWSILYHEICQATGELGSLHKHAFYNTYLRFIIQICFTRQTEVNLETMEPKDTLAPAALEWCHSIGSDARSVSDIVNQKDVAILKSIQDGINVANKSATSRAQCIQKWSILPRDFSVPGGELGKNI